MRFYKCDICGLEMQEKNGYKVPIVTTLRHMTCNGEMRDAGLIVIGEKYNICVLCAKEISDSIVKIAKSKGTIINNIDRI